MGEIETQLYQDQPYDEPDVLARKILRDGAVKIVRDCYKWRGKIYWIVNGRVLTRAQAERLEDERRREGRTQRPFAAEVRS